MPFSCARIYKYVNEADGIPCASNTQSGQEKAGDATFFLISERWCLSAELGGGECPNDPSFVFFNVKTFAVCFFFFIFASKY